MASSGLCSLIEAGDIEYHKVMYYQDILLKQKQQKEKQQQQELQLDSRVWV